MIYTNDVSGLIALERTRKAVTKKKSTNSTNKKKIFLIFIEKRKMVSPLYIM